MILVFLEGAGTINPPHAVFQEPCAVRVKVERFRIVTLKYSFTPKIQYSTNSENSVYFPLSICIKV